MGHSTARFASGMAHPAMPAVIFTLALALALFGCGGSGPPPTVTSGTTPATWATAVAAATPVTHPSSGTTTATPEMAAVTVAAPVTPEGPAARAAANPAAFRAALDAYHHRDPEAFRAGCTTVMRQVLWAIAELDGADYAPGVRTRLVRERALARLSATSSGWQGATMEHLKAFEAACDAHLPASIPIGPGDAG